MNSDELPEFGNSSDELMDEETRASARRRFLPGNKVPVAEDLELYQDSDASLADMDSDQGSSPVMETLHAPDILTNIDIEEVADTEPPNLDFSLADLGFGPPKPSPKKTAGPKLNQADQAELNSLMKLFFRIASKQFGFILQVPGAKFIATWLKSKDFSGTVSASKTEKAIVAICDKVRIRFPGLVALDIQILQAVVEEFEAIFGLAEDGTEITRANFEHTLNRSFDSLDIEDQQPASQVLDITKYFYCIDAFKMPHLVYNKVMKNFVNNPSPKKILTFGGNRAEVYLERYQLLKLKILRNDLFAPPSVFDSKTSHLVLTPIKSLLGRISGQFCLFGMFLQQNDGSFALQDEDSSVRLQFVNSCRYGRGLFTEYCFVLVEGEMTEDEVFNVHSITLTPYEDRDTTHSAYGDVRWLGKEVAPIPKHILKSLSEEFSDLSIVFLSDIHLDRNDVLQGLRRLFEMLEENGLPLAIVMLGSFTSLPITSDKSRKDYQENFNKLGSMILEFESLASWCRFIMVPGPDDPVLLKALPTPPLPNLYHRGLSDKVANVTFTSNPTRIQIADKELVILRKNLVNKSLRNLILPLPDKVATNPISIQKHFVRTIVDSGHLVPLPPNIEPILLGYDHSLRLAQNPNLLVMADNTPPFSTEYKNTKFVNPGPFIPIFPKHSINYFNYCPFQDLLEQRTVDLNQVLH